MPERKQLETLLEIKDNPSLTQRIFSSSFKHLPRPYQRYPAKPDSSGMG